VCPKVIILLVGEILLAEHIDEIDTNFRMDIGAKLSNNVVNSPVGFADNNETVTEEANDAGVNSM